MIIAALCALIAIQQIVVLLVCKMSAEERRRMLHAIVTATPAEYVAVERAVSTKPVKRAKRDALVPVQPIGL